MIMVLIKNASLSTNDGTLLPSTRAVWDAERAPSSKWAEAVSWQRNPCQGGLCLPLVLILVAIACQSLDSSDLCPLTLWSKVWLCLSWSSFSESELSWLFQQFPNCSHRFCLTCFPHGPQLDWGTYLKSSLSLPPWPLQAPYKPHQWWKSQFFSVH